MISTSLLPLPILLPLLLPPLSLPPSPPPWRTYIEIQDDENRRALVNANPSRYQRSIVSKLKLGILPLQIEVGRWKDVALEDRYCRVCGDDVLENEYHFLMYCEGLAKSRTDFYLEMHNKYDVDMYGPQDEVMSAMPSNQCIKTTARHVEIMWKEVVV